jgi:hypothetical protein
MMDFRCGLISSKRRLASTQVGARVPFGVVNVCMITALFYAVVPQYFGIHARDFRTQFPGARVLCKIVPGVELACVGYSNQIVTR